MRKKTILITGGSGYIGRNLQAYLKNSYRILAPSHRDLDLVDSNAVEAYLKRRTVDVIINCAVVGGSRIEEHVAGSIATNLRIFFNIVRCQKYYKKMIHLGSGAEYDKTRPLKQIKETEFGKRVPIDEYGFYKYVCGKYIEASTEPVINLRIFGLFGPGEDYRLRFISNIMVRVLLSKPLEMNQDAYFDYVYIKDFVRIIEYFIKHNGAYRSYNIGSGKQYRLSDIAKKIIALSGSHMTLQMQKKGLNKEYTCDNTLLMGELKGFSFMDFDASLNELFTWYQKRKLTLQL